jgi:hypothetical protein
MVRLILISTFLFSFGAAAKVCRPSQGELALAFAEVRARLAVAAGQCMGYSTDVDAQQFSRFLSRHKDWATKGDEWSGLELIRIQQAKGSPRSIGSQHYVNLIYQEQEVSRSRKAQEYCADALTRYRQWVDLNGGGLQSSLKQMICLKQQLATTPSAPTPIGN